MSTKQPDWLSQVQQFHTGAVHGDADVITDTTAVGAALSAIADGMAQAVIPPDASTDEWQRAQEAFYAAVRLNDKARSVRPFHLNCMRSMLKAHAAGQGVVLPAQEDLVEWRSSVSAAYIVARQYDHTVPSHWLEAMRDILLSAKAAA